MFLEILSFIHGILSNVIDYMYDSKLFLEYQKVFELLFVVFKMKLYPFTYQTLVSFVISLVSFFVFFVV